MVPRTATWSASSFYYRQVCRIMCYHRLNMFGGCLIYGVMFFWEFPKNINYELVPLMKRLERRITLECIDFDVSIAQNSIRSYPYNLLYSFSKW